ncbi:MAG: serine hydrolase domain-containing protein [Vicingaceae bacterium]
MKKLILIILFFPFLGLCQEPVDIIDSVVASKFNNGPAVSVLISKDFKSFYSKIKGYSNIELGVKANDSTKFRIGSNTKQFTAIAVLKLMEEGKLNLTDTIQTFLPDFAVKDYPITIEHLLTHTSGLAEITELDIFYSHLMKNGGEPDSLLKYFQDLPLDFPPGSRFSYSNSGYHVLGLIIERASGMSYNDYIRTNLLSIAEMKNTLADNNSSIMLNRAHGYEELFTTLRNADYIDMSIPFSGGNLLSTSEDLNKWYKTLFAYRIVSENTLTMAHSPFQLNDGTYSNYGYGWFVDSLQGERIISHEGGINGFLSSVWYVPSSKTLTVLLSNCHCNPTVKTAERLTAIAIGKPLTEKKRIKLSDTLLKSYSGIYLMDGEEWTISINEKELYFQFPNGNGHPIYPVSENEFFAEEWDSEFKFYEFEGKTEFHFIYLGEVIKGEKSKTVHNSSN